MIIMCMKTKNTKQQKCTDKEVWKNVHKTDNSGFGEGGQEAFSLSMYSLKCLHHVQAHIFCILKNVKIKKPKLIQLQISWRLFLSHVQLAKIPISPVYRIYYLQSALFLLFSRECFYCKVERKLHEDGNQSVLLVVVSLVLSTVSATQQVFKY